MISSAAFVRVAAALAAAVSLAAPPAAAQPAARPAGDKNLVEERREILSYGIDEEVLQVLDALAAARDKALLPELARIVAGPGSQAVKVKVLDYLGLIKEPIAEQAAAALLAAEPLPGDDLVVASLRYLDAIDSAGLGAAARGLVDHEKLAVAGAAVRALKKDQGACDLLLSKLKDERTAPELKPEMILVLGELRCAAAYDELAAIVDDSSQDKTWRMYAAESLGRLGDPRAVPLLRQLFAEDDALLRAHAAAALGRFAEPGVNELLEQALKDSNWRVRSTGIKALAERREKSAVPILAYKARRDPVARVRLDAIAALGQIGGGEGMDTLRELYAGAGTSTDIRLAALEALLEGDLEASVETVEKVVAAEWGRETRTSRIVEQTAARLATRESPRLRRLLERFLDSPNANVRVAGLRGIALNHLRELRERVERVSRDDPTPGVRKEAALALERL